MNRAASLGGAIAAFLLASCAAAEGPRTVTEAPPPRPGPQEYASFADWRSDFRARALSEGIRADVFDAAFAGVEVNERVMELDAFQPEFIRPIWEYLDGAVSDTRVANGREQLAAKSALLDGIEARYRVDREVVLAIWGLESAYGYNYGDIRVIESLATLAYEGRRREFAEQQLLSALRILQAGDVSPSRMVGSWAGAMGHTQFMPTSFEDYAVDYTGDGRRDLWADDAADALASTANYLARFGWEFGQPWGVEVRLPQGFDYTLADGSSRRAPAQWMSIGVRQVGGRSLPEAGEAAIIAPAGASGPAFAIYKNFRVIRRYNNSTSYALGVGRLADRIAGGGPIVAEWPRHERRLTPGDMVEMQERLTALGYDTQGADGIIGPNSRTAIRDFQRSQGMIPDGHPNDALLARLRAAQG